MSHRAALVPIAVLALAALAGCAPDRGLAPEPTTASGSPSAPSGTATPSAAPTEGASGLSVACDTLLTPQAVYDWNPNVALVNGPAPADGSDAARVAALGGTVCSLQNLSSNEVTEVAVTRLAPSDADAVRADAEAVGPATTIAGVEAHVGSERVWAFDGDLWIVVAGPVVASAEDAEPLVTAALAGA